MQYLTNWRMQVATGHLLSGRDSVAVIANLVGYESEAAFSRSFKKVVGTSPSHWRRERGRARPSRRSSGMRRSRVTRCRSVRILGA